MAATITTSQGLTPGLPGGVSAALNLTASQVIKAEPGIVAKVSCVASGNLTLNDSATTGEAAAANEFFNATMTAGQVIELDWPCAAGITASVVTTGTFAISFT